MINGMVLGLFFTWHNLLPAKPMPWYHFNQPNYFARKLVHVPTPIFRLQPTLKPTHTPKPTHSPKPTHTPKPTKTPIPTPTKTPTPTPTNSPTPTPIPQAQINSVVLHFCSENSSCYGWTTGVEVIGNNFASNTRTTLKNGSTVYSGFYQGGNHSSILTDFYNLPHCLTLDVVVSGSTGTVTSPASVATLCP